MNKHEETKYLGTTDVARIIRKELKTKFPETKFSVRSSKYSMGSSIHINWDNGPTEDQIKKIVRKYESKDFDGMIDLEFYYYHYMLPDGTIEMWGSEGTSRSAGVYPNWEKDLPEGAVKVSLSSGYIFTDRTVTDDWVLKIAKAAHKHYGALENVAEPMSVDDLSKSFTFGHDYMNWYQLTYRIHQKLDLTNMVEVIEDPDFTSGGGMYEGFLTIRGD